MKTKKQLKPGIRTSKRIASNVNINFTQKITDKYGIGNLKSQFTKLIFRQYKRMLAGENLQTDTESNTVIKNHSNYFNYINTSKYVLNYLTQTINQDNNKNNKEMPVPFNILRATQLNSCNNLQPDLFYSVQRQRDVIRNGSSDTALSYVGITGRPTIINLFKQLSEKYIKTIAQNVSQNASSYINKLYKRETAEPHWIKPLQQQRYAKAAHKTVLRASDTMGLLLKTQSLKKHPETLEKAKVQLDSEKLIHDAGMDHELQALTPRFPKIVTLEQQPLKNRFSDRSLAIAEESDRTEPQQRYAKALNKTILRVSRNMGIMLKPHNILETEVQLKNKKQLSFFINSQRQHGLTHGESIEHELKALRPGIPKAATFEEQTTQNRISERINNIVLKNTITNRSPGIPPEKRSGVNTVNQDQNNLKADTDTKPENVPENEKEAPNQNKIILRTSTTNSALKKDFTPTSQGFIKSALVQADGAISKIIGSFSKKQNEEKGFQKKNIYQHSTELIPTALKKERQAETAQKEEQDVKRFFEKNNDSSLTLFKPHKQDTVLETGQVPNDLMTGNKDVGAKTVSSSKSKNISIDDIDTGEVNLLAEKILKILEKRMSIQKDRRGLR